MDESGIDPFSIPRANDLQSAVLTNIESFDVETNTSYRYFDNIIRINKRFIIIIYHL